MIIGSVFIVAIFKSISQNNGPVDVENIVSGVVPENHSLGMILLPFVFALFVCLILTLGSFLARLARSHGYPPM